ncbi:hypothetical protein HPB47_010822 [Ixodes persulcatus]|uniref:Uncharacterized protein n=1 Tax=Ixodes persulcatus TaxID=34615 RepID=A0AC60NY22_IXOPE|nr:hypothetical protein HPB47_010822 [Ixodes persulcatus]
MLASFGQGWTQGSIPARFDPGMSDPLLPAAPQQPKHRFLAEPAELRPVRDLSLSPPVSAPPRVFSHHLIVASSPAREAAQQKRVRTSQGSTARNKQEHVFGRLHQRTSVAA